MVLNKKLPAPAINRKILRDVVCAIFTEIRKRL